MEGRHHISLLSEKMLPKKWMTCLRCGRRIFTDVYHRLCRRCKIRNGEVGGSSDCGHHVDTESLRDILGRGRWDQF